MICSYWKWFYKDFMNPWKHCLATYHGKADVFGEICCQISLVLCSFSLFNVKISMEKKSQHGPPDRSSSQGCYAQRGYMEEQNGRVM